MSVFDETTARAWLSDALGKPGVGPRLKYILEELADLLVDGPLTLGLEPSISQLTMPTALPPDVRYCGVTTTSGNVTATLADAAITGHVLAIKVEALGGAHTVAITPANFADGATITFNTLGESCIMYFDGADWQLVHNNGGVVT